MISIEKAGINDIATIQDLARRTWSVVYTSIIGPEQIAYMLNLMYGTPAMEDQILNQGHHFLLVKENGLPLGYASFSRKSAEEQEIFRLHKLYVLPDQHGKGIGRKLLEYISAEITPQGAKALELNVNKKNPAVEFYKKSGFTVSREMVLDIGAGYVMDDYVMTLHYQ